MFKLSRLIFTHPIFTALVALVLGTQFPIAKAQTSPIRFDVEVPRPPEEMQVFKLAPTRPRSHS